MPKIKKEKTGNFTILDNQVIRDSSLSFKARGLFTYLWSQKDGWNYYEREIVKHTTDGIAAVRTGLHELEEHGYLKRTRERKSGKLGGAVWVLSESGKFKKCEKPILENHTQENHTYENYTYENQTLRNTNQKKHQPEETLTRSNNNVQKQVLHDSQLESEFKSLWERYPNKKGKKAALRHYKAWRRKKPKEHSYLYISKKLNNYLAYIREKGTKPEFIMNGSTWFNGRFDDELKVDTVKDDPNDENSFTNLMKKDPGAPNTDDFPF